MRSSLAFCYRFPGEVPPTTEWAGQLVAPHSGLLLLRSTGESGEGLRASFRLKTGRWRALPELLVWNKSNLGDWASPEPAKSIADSIVDDADNRVVSVWVVLLPHATWYPLGRYEVELALAGVVDPTWTSEEHSLIQAVGGTCICSNEGVDVSYGAGCDVSFGWAAGLNAVIDFLAWLRGVFLGVVVSLQVTHVSKHEMSLCIVRTSSSLSFVSGVSPRRSWELSGSVQQMVVNSYVSGRCCEMSETQCWRFDGRDSLSEAECHRLDVRNQMSETQCQRLNGRDSMSESDLLNWSRCFATPRTLMNNLILVYRWIVYLLCLVFHPWTAAKPLVNADQLLTAFMSSVVFWTTEAQVSLVQFETQVGHLRGTPGGAIMMVVWRIWGSLGGYEDCWVDITVVKLTLIDLSE